MFVRVVIAFLLLPGTFGLAVPLLLVRFEFSSFHLMGLPLLAVGFVLLLWCVRDFYVAGKGTLAPWTPPRNLVVVGLYRFSRNPMYLSLLLILSGWVLAFRSQTLLIYALIVMLAFHLRVVFGEEPWLARRYGEQWERYKAKIPRWLF